MSSRRQYLARTLSLALRENLLNGGTRRRQYLRSLARQPVEAAAAGLMAALPVVELGELTSLEGASTVSVGWGDRGSWSIGIAERLALEAIVRGRGARSVFEIGTFNGGTTAMLAAAVPADGRVVTLDLPPAAFDATQGPSDLDGSRVGELWRASPDAAKVEQVLHDSMTFDAAPYAGQFDLVLVDGAHDYEHGVHDTLTALTLARPGGLVVFDDFTPYWAGLVRGIVESSRGQRLARLDRTNLGVIELAD